MKALQVKYLSATNTKPARLKIQAPDCSFSITPIDSQREIDTQVLELAAWYTQQYSWNVIISGMGALPNGDWAVTLKDGRS